MVDAAVDFLYFGDSLTLFDVDLKGYLASHMSRSAYTHFYAHFPQ
jgi:hypothetical protein